MSLSVKLPALGESVVEGTVARWLVAEGERVEIDQSICEVTTDKVDAEIPAPASGVIERILAPEGATVEVGAELALLREGDEVDAPADAAVDAPAHAAADAPADAGVLATPVARRMAAEADLALGEIHGTGSAGRVTKSDVLAHPPAARPLAETPDRHRDVAPRAPAPPSRTAAATPPLSQLALDLEEGDRVVPMSPQRRMIAAHMVYSKRTSPHVGTVAEVDFGAVAQQRSAGGSVFRERHGVALTYLPFVVHAVVRALREWPALNAAVTEDAIVERQSVHVSLAVETEKGLVAPVLRHTDRLSLSGIALGIEDLVTRARSRRLSPDDLRGGTFTVSNPGRRGNLYGFAIINQPQVGILRMGEIVKRPVVREVGGADAIVVRPTMHLALSYDHRAVDGAPANAFLHRVRELLEAGGFEL